MKKVKNNKPPVFPRWKYVGDSGVGISSVWRHTS